MDPFASAGALLAIEVRAQAFVSGPRGRLIGRGFAKKKFEVPPG